MANVIVGCKLPHGLVLRLKGVENPVTLKGANSGTIVGLDGNVMRGTCGYTSVDEAFITQWLKVFGNTTMVKNKLIFVQKNQASAEAQAKDQIEQKTGFEAVNPDKPSVAGITKADPQEKAE